VTGRPRLVLLDRDGTINRKAPEGAYVTAPHELDLLDGADIAIARLNAARIRVAVVTNQRGVALGRMTASDVADVHAELAFRLAERCARVDAYFVCPHEEGACDCRKPRPGLLLQAIHHFHVRPNEAVMIGDAATDIEAGRRAGTRTVRLGARSSEPMPDAYSADLSGAVDLVMNW
jgi:D-glycero-D-manno-heptose 1,7-bisphosphate phosphatase